MKLLLLISLLLLVSCNKYPPNIIEASKEPLIDTSPAALLKEYAEGRGDRLLGRRIRLVSTVIRGRKFFNEWCIRVRGDNKTEIQCNAVNANANVDFILEGDRVLIEGINMGKSLDVIAFNECYVR